MLLIAFFVVCLLLTVGAVFYVAATDSPDLTEAGVQVQEDASYRDAA